jgi:hypothetical protein
MIAQIYTAVLILKLLHYFSVSILLRLLTTECGFQEFYF